MSIGKGIAVAGIWAGAAVIAIFGHIPSSDQWWILLGAVLATAAVSA